MTGAGALTEEIELQALVTVSDGAGGSTQSWETVLTAPARIRVLKAGEAVMQGRLASTQTVVCTLRWQPDLADAKTTWKLRNVRSNQQYEIKAITPSEDKAWCDILCETGVI
jgi:SPP1 family predicted phage head-tail adaptor